MDNILKETRQKLGLTQGAMADKLGIHKQTYIRYEKGSREVPSSIMKQLAEISGETLNYLFGYNNYGNIMGNNNTQIAGSNISVGESSNDSKDFLEIVDLLRNYGNTKLLADLKNKLLKIKRLS